ncbi:hypothetical protein ABIC08_007687 [Bradyrhizobium sp. RT9b]|uniref:hypothetical protein n=1 Tax=unclassified Bradyrhizobium TaxID=2631580 RepID=UPI0033998B39
MFAQTLEAVQSSPSKRTIYVRLVLTALALMVLFKTLRFGRWGAWQVRELSDFDAFYITAQQVWRGQLDLVYRFETLTKLQAEAYNGATSFMPWTYTRSSISWWHHLRFCRPESPISCLSQRR